VSTTSNSEPSAGSHRVYDAFISYRHVEPDRTWASWLLNALETYRPPEHGGQRRRFTPLRVFRDEAELATSSDLAREVRKALEASQFLIVVCSRATPA